MKALKTYIVLVALITGCSQDRDDIAQQGSTSFEASIGPCELVLADGDGDSTVITHYQSLIEQNIQTVKNLENLGWAYIQNARSQFDQGFYNLALSTARCINIKNENHLPADFLKAYALAQLHQFKQAEIITKELIHKRGLWFEYGLHGDSLMEQGKLIEAAQAYQKMMNLKPGPQAYSRAAHLRWLTGDLEGAIEMMHMAAGSIGTKNDQWAWLNTRLGFYLFNANKLSDAQSLTNQVLSSYKNYAPALFLRGQIFLANNKLNQAISDFNRAVELHPLPEYQWALIDTFKFSEKSDQSKIAKLQFDKTAITEDHRTYSLYLASINKNNRLALQLSRNEFDSRQDIFTHDALAWSLFMNDQVNLASEHANIAVSNQTPHARLFYHCALINYDAQQTEQAQYCFDKALEYKHMLLLSEKRKLKTAFAKFVSLKTFYKAESGLNNEPTILTGEKHENTI